MLTLAFNELMLGLYDCLFETNNDFWETYFRNIKDKRSLNHLSVATVALDKILEKIKKIKKINK